MAGLEKTGSALAIYMVQSIHVHPSTFPCSQCSPAPIVIQSASTPPPKKGLQKHQGKNERTGSPSGLEDLFKGRWRLARSSSARAPASERERAGERLLSRSRRARRHAGGGSGGPRGGVGRPKGASGFADDRPATVQFYKRFQRCTRCL